MIPRKKLDIGWADLACGLSACLFAGDRDAVQQWRRIDTNLYSGKIAVRNFFFLEKSMPGPAFGGTGNFGYEDMTIENKSLFVTYSYHWHNCAGNATSQMKNPAASSGVSKPKTAKPIAPRGGELDPERFKLHNNSWKMIGVTSFETSQIAGSGVDVFSDTNLITGNAIVKRTRHGKSTTEKLKKSPRTILFRDYARSQEWISMHEKKPLC